MSSTEVLSENSFKEFFPTIHFNIYPWIFKKISTNIYQKDTERTAHKITLGVYRKKMIMFSEISFRVTLKIHQFLSEFLGNNPSWHFSKGSLRDFSRNFTEDSSKNFWRNVSVKFSLRIIPSKILRRNSPQIPLRNPPNVSLKFSPEIVPEWILQSISLEISPKNHPEFLPKMSSKILPEALWKISSEYFWK